MLLTCPCLVHRGQELVLRGFLLDEVVRAVEVPVEHRALVAVYVQVPVEEQGPEERVDLAEVLVEPLPLPEVMAVGGNKRWLLLLSVLGEVLQALEELESLTGVVLRLVVELAPEFQNWLGSAPPEQRASSRR